MTETELKELLKKSYEEGQIQGIALACDQLSTAILEFKEKIISEWNTRK